MRKRKSDFRTLIFPIFTAVIIITGIILRLFAYFRFGYNVIGDECHSLVGSILPVKDLFTSFVQGTNFLPLYRCLLSFLHNIAGFNWPLFKLPSVIASICSIFVFYKILNKVFDNKLLISGALSLFCINYTLIHFAVRIKPYSTDVLLILLIVYFTILLSEDLKCRNLSFGKTLKYALVSVVMCFLSLPAIMYVQICFLWFFIKTLAEKTFKNLYNLLIFEFVVATSVLFEYFIYISQMSGDGDLKQQWINGGYFFAPNSYKAINSLIHFTFFKFEFFDYDLNYMFPEFVLIFFVILFSVGSINFLLKHNDKQNKLLFYLFVCPVLLLVLLSFAGIYPFCNRMIIFLIPVIMICTVNAFDFSQNKCVNVLSKTVFVCFILLMFVYMFKTGEMKRLLTDENQGGIGKKEIEFAEQIKSENEIILSNENLCSYCTDNKNVLIILPESYIENNKVTYLDRRTGETKEVDSVAEAVIGYNKIYFIYEVENINDIDTEKNKTVINELKNSNYKEIYKEVNGFFVYSVMEK